jgi:flagellar hook-basal body complex protein FliE
MDISSLYNVSSNVIKEAAKTSSGDSTVNSSDAFSSILNSAIENINTTNSYLSDMENEELKFAMGETENTHDLLVATMKASTALQYTVAIRDKFLDSYKELMNMQI